MDQPSYQELPKKGTCYRYAWDYFNSVNEQLDRKDQLGTLNFLTPERRAQAAKDEITTGKSISLDLSLDHFAADIKAFGGRSAPVHTIKKVAPFVCEDSLDFNTQSASQWDGLRHFGLRSTGQFYNEYTVADFEVSDALSTHYWVENGGICGRGVLIDYASWALSKNDKVDVNGGHCITLSNVEEVLAFQKTKVRPGDILLFRTGWLKWYNETNPTERHEELCVRNEPGQHSFVGLQSSADFVEWLWDNQIAAVAGDQVAFECTPPPADGFGWLHEHLLACLGCPIGELWNTEALAETCKAKNRYTFFLSSVPLHTRGGVASTANAIAIM